MAYKEYLAKVVVSPKKQISDYENDLKSLDLLMAEVESFMFREITEGKSESSKEK